ncbi:MAG: hypothetical protein QOI08_4412 [Actinomycetota bacterium]|nr:hypothetical protein [Actinomycetota bacterium]
MSRLPRAVADTHRGGVGEKRLRVVPHNEPTGSGSAAAMPAGSASGDEFEGLIGSTACLVAHLDTAAHILKTKAWPRVRSNLRERRPMGGSLCS